MVNKIISWQVYLAATDKAANPERVDSRFDKFWDWLSDQFWIDISLDLAAVLLFAFAVVKLATAALQGG